MPTVIEFLGHAGSGKSFLASRLAESLGDQCIGTESFSMRMSDVFQFMATNPGKLVLIFKYVYFSRQTKLRAFLKSLRRVLVYYVKLEMATRQRKQFVIISEGALKIFNDIRTSSLCKNLGYEEVPPSIRRQIFCKADVVVFVFSPLEVVAKRLALRENPGAKATDIKNWLARIERNFHSSIKDNRNNIQAAMGEHKFKLIEFENSESCHMDVAVANMTGEILRMSNSA